MHLVVVDEHRRKRVEVVHVRAPELGGVAAPVELTAETLDAQRRRGRCSAARSTRTRSPRSGTRRSAGVTTRARRRTAAPRRDRRRARRRVGARAPAPVVLEADGGRDVGGAGNFRAVEHAGGGGGQPVLEAGGVHERETQAGVLAAGDVHPQRPVEPRAARGSSRPVRRLPRPIPPD